MLRGVEAELGELGHEPVGGAVAIREMGGNRGDRRDPEKGEQSLEGPPPFGVDFGQNVVDCSHRAPPLVETRRSCFGPLL